MSLKEKLENMMVAVTFAEANCPKQAQYYLKQKKVKSVRPVKRTENRVRPDSRIRL
ncbi:MAG: hypothetical protein Q9M37_06680 [Desulfonauticus sp.]|nr:hypothetical protein [Desulfonauticus sp.]